MTPNSVEQTAGSHSLTAAALAGDLVRYRKAIWPLVGRSRTFDRV